MIYLREAPGAGPTFVCCGCCIVAAIFASCNNSQCKWNEHATTRKENEPVQSNMPNMWLSTLQKKKGWVRVVVKQNTFEQRAHWLCTVRERWVAYFDFDIFLERHDLFFSLLKTLLELWVCFTCACARERREKENAHARDRMLCAARSVRVRGRERMRASEHIRGSTTYQNGQIKTRSSRGSTTHQGC